MGTTLHAGQRTRKKKRKIKLNIENGKAMYLYGERATQNICTCEYIDIIPNAHLSTKAHEMIVWLMDFLFV